MKIDKKARGDANRDILTGRRRKARGIRDAGGNDVN
jgi:hypothetical protein